MSDWTTNVESDVCSVTRSSCKFKNNQSTCSSCGRIPSIHQKGAFSTKIAVNCSAGGLCTFNEAEICINCGNKPQQLNSLKANQTLAKPSDFNVSPLCFSSFKYLNSIKRTKLEYNRFHWTHLQPK